MRNYIGKNYRFSKGDTSNSSSWDLGLRLKGLGRVFHN